MIPYIEQTYNISYARVAILFVATFFGYVATAPIAGALVRRFGFGRMLCFSVLVELLGACLTILLLATLSDIMIINRPSSTAHSI